jgi:ribonuclease E
MPDTTPTPAETDHDVAEPAASAADSSGTGSGSPPRRRRRATSQTTTPPPSVSDGVVSAPADGAVDVPSEDETLIVAAPPRDDAPTGDPEEPSDGGAVETEVPAAPVPSFGLLFQAPQPTLAPQRRRATAPAQAPAERIADEPSSDDSGDAAPDVAAGSGDGTDAADDQTGGRRRRRGGRGRRGRNTGVDEARGDADANSDDDAAPATDADQSSAEDDDGATEGGTSRRRRRRRRSGSGSVDGDDPPGTVTKVRELRAAREEPTAVKGSTRLEAKKQRRREGREAGRRRTIITEAEFLARRESVERVMVVRGREGRTQIGVLEDGVLVEHYVSRETTASMVGNVYLGRVQNVLPSMEAAFVDIGKGRNAALYAGEVNWDAAGLETNQPKRIENALSSGSSVLVQVTKDPIGHKGARLTSQISLPGRYLVYVPQGSMTGISRKLPDTERARLKSILKQVVPDSAGVIVRTAAEGASEDELKADVARLTKAWERISSKAEAAAKKKSGNGGAPALLHGEPDLTVRVIRDVFTEDFTSLVVSGDAAWSEVRGYVDDVAPDLASRVQQWTAEEDVFAAHRIDEQLAKAMDRKVWLPSGGSLVIDRTEAMTVVDVNTGKFVGSGGNLEETVTKNNVEAAEEIVRQLRLRDIGGIIVVDFIDMVLESNRDLVVRRLLECLGRDRTKHQVAEVTSLGLVQMTRKRVGSGLIEVFSEPCEHCAGRGLIVQTEPVERGSSGGSSGSRSGRGRRSGARSSDGTDDAPRPPSGPTAAQIAAAAHAAAVRTSHDDGAGGEPASDAVEVVDLGDPTDAVEVVDLGDSSDAVEVISVDADRSSSP